MLSSHPVKMPFLSSSLALGRPGLCRFSGQKPGVERPFFPSMSRLAASNPQAVPSAPGASLPPKAVVQQPPNPPPAPVPVPVAPQPASIIDAGGETQDSPPSHSELLEEAYGLTPESRAPKPVDLPDKPPALAHQEPLLVYEDTFGTGEDLQAVLSHNGLQFAAEESGFCNLTYGNLLMKIKESLSLARPSRMTTLLAAPVAAVGALALEVVTLPVWLCGKDEDLGYDSLNKRRNNPFQVTYGMLRAATETLVARKINTQSLARKISKQFSPHDLYALERALEQMHQNGLVIFRQEPGVSHVGLTPTGQDFLKAVGEDHYRRIPSAFPASPF